MDAVTQIRIHTALHPNEARDLMDVLFEIASHNGAPGVEQTTQPFQLSERQAQTVIHFATILQSRVTEVDGIRST